MLFARKPRPPFCAELSDAEVALLRKILHTESSDDMDRYVGKIVRKGMEAVCVAVVQQEPGSFQGGEFTKYMFLASMIKHADPVSSAYALARTSSLRPEWHGDLLGRLLPRLSTDDYRQKLVADLSSDPVILSAALSTVVCSDVVFSNFSPSTIRANADILVKHGADVHYRDGVLMSVALRREMFDVVHLLENAGFDYAAYGEKVRQGLHAFKQMNVKALAYLDEKTGSGEAAAPVDDAPSLADGQEGIGYVLSGDSVSLSGVLPDGGSLTTVFNFATRQQIIIAHVAGQTSAPAVTPFSKIEGEDGLRAAAAAFVALGGDAARVADIEKAASCGQPVLIAKPANPPKPAEK